MEVGGGGQGHVLCCTWQITPTCMATISAVISPWAVTLLVFNSKEKERKGEKHKRKEKRGCTPPPPVPIVVSIVYFNSDLCGWPQGVHMSIPYELVICGWDRIDNTQYHFPPNFLCIFWIGHVLLSKPIQATLSSVLTKPLQYPWAIVADIYTCNQCGSGRVNHIFTKV